MYTNIVYRIICISFNCKKEYNFLILFSPVTILWFSLGVNRDWYNLYTMSVLYINFILTNFSSGFNPDRLHGIEYTTCML